MKREEILPLHAIFADSLTVTIMWVRPKSNRTAKARQRPTKFSSLINAASNASNATDPLVSNGLTNHRKCANWSAETSHTVPLLNLPLDGGLFHAIPWKSASRFDITVLV